MILPKIRELLAENGIDYRDVMDCQVTCSVFEPPEITVRMKPNHQAIRIEVNKALPYEDRPKM